MVEKRRRAVRFYSATRPAHRASAGVAASTPLAKTMNQEMSLEMRIALCTFLKMHLANQPEDVKAQKSMYKYLTLFVLWQMK